MQKPAKKLYSWPLLLIYSIIIPFLFFIYNNSIRLLLGIHEILFIILSGLGSILLFFGAFYLEIFVLKKFSPQDIGLKNYTLNGKWNFLFIIGLAILLFFFKKVISTILTPLVSSANTADINVEPPNTITYIIILIFLGLITPIAEESFYRGFLFNAVENRSNVIIASLFSSILFGIAHLDIIQGISAFIVGIMCCLVYYKTRSIYSPILLHCLGNVLVLIFW